MFGLILRSVGGDDEVGYGAWLCYKNDHFFSRNVYISKRAQLERVVDRMKHMDIANYPMQ